MKTFQAVMLGILCLALPFSAFSQNDFECGFDSIVPYHSSYDSLQTQLLNQVQDFRQRNPTLTFLPNGGVPGGTQGSSTLTCRKAKYLIPVVVHVIYDVNDSTTNISEDQIMNQLEVLNANLANAHNAGSPAVNTGIQVCLATRDASGNPVSGITRRAHSLTNVKLTINELYGLFQQDYYPADKYLNIWIVNSILSPSGADDGVQAIGIPPSYAINGRDGIIIRCKRFGDTQSCTGCNLYSISRGRTLVHEFGHYLGLWHTFQDGCVGTDTSTCASLGDWCCDTPPVHDANRQCSSTRNSCTETPSDQNDQTQNYMDYGGEGCWTTFTAGQAAIMYAMLENGRKGLISPVNLNAARLDCCKYYARFEPDKPTLCNPDSITFTAVDSISGATYRWYVFNSSGSLVYFSSSAGSHPKIYLNTIGAYMVKLTLIAQSDSISYSLEDSVRVFDCGNPLASEQANWYFGYLCGLNFRQNLPKVDIQPYIRKPNIASFEVSQSQSNSYGHLLFYAGADYEAPFYNFELRLFNKNYQKMPNSDSMYLHFSSAQGVIAVPKPGDGSRYYLFHGFSAGPDWGGLFYTIIDTSLYGGTGGVDSTQKNVPVLPPSGTTSEPTVTGAIPMGESITAISKCNGTDYWIVFQEGSSPGGGYSNYGKVMVYSLTSSGLSYTSSYYTGLNPSPNISQLKFSPDGKFLFGWGRLFAFDRSSGNITGVVFTVTDATPYGAAFSPNSRFLYLYHANDNSIYQYDVYSANPTTSKKYLGQIYSNGQLQLGPDGKIYISGFGRKNLFMIANPNLPDSVAGACGFTANGPTLLANGIGGIPKLGLPNFIDGKKPPEYATNFQYKVTNCRTVKFYPNKSCLSSVAWDFGDVTSSNTLEPTHTYSKDSTYTVRFIAGADTIVKVITIGIPKPTISGNSIACDSSIEYFYSTPYKFNYSYQWSLVNGTFASPSTFSETQVNWSQAGSIKITVTNLTTGCVDTTRLYVDFIPFLNKIDSIVSDTVCPASPLHIIGSSPCNQSLQATYRWQYKTTGMGSFANLPGYYASTNKDIDENSWYHQCNLRRRAIVDNDTSYSDTIFIAFTILNNYIKQVGISSPYRYAICSGQNPPNLVGSDTCTYSYWYYQWQSSTDTSDVNGWQNISGEISPTFSPSINNVTMYYRRRTIHAYTSDTAYSPAFQLRIKDPQITTQPSNANVTEGAVVTFHTICSDMQPVKWQQGKLVGGSMVWTDMTSGWLILPNPSAPYEFTFNLYVTAEACLNGRKYRAVYQSACQSPGTYTYGDEATLSVTPITYDLWSRDYVGDIGAEPTPSWNFIWNSPDIWNTKTQTYTGTTHEQPEYRYTDPNYVHAIVRNKSGQSTSPAAKLYLYWTFASTGEKWPRNWQFNPDETSYYGNWKMFYGVKKGLGGLIGVYTIPPISSGGTWRIDTPWVAPHPGILFGDSTMGHKADICFLSRIVTCSESQFGMYAMEFMDLGYNVRMNNNIVTKNFVLFDLLPGNQRKSWIGNGNPLDNTATLGKLRLRPGDCDLFDYAYILLHLDATLVSIWNNTDGFGYTVVNDSTLKVEHCGEVILTDIEYGADQTSLIGVEVVVRNDYNISTPIDVYYEFDVEELIGSDTLSVGGVHYGVPMHLEPIPDLDMVRRNPETTKPDKGITTFKAYPNPFTDELKISYKLPVEEKVTITVTNLLGQKITTIENNSLKVSGMHKLSFNSALLKEGIYFINFTAGSFTQTQKVVLIR